MFNKIVLIAITAAVANANTATLTNALDSSELAQTSVDGTEWKKCGTEWGKGNAGKCDCKGRIKYGAKGKFFYKNSNGVKNCNNKTFGDPIWHVVKACYCQEKTAPKPKKQKTATYADTSFLDSMSAFGEAQERMRKFEAKRMALVAARYKKIGIYFSYVKREIAARKLKKRWNRIWMSAIKAHDAAIKAHKFSWNAMQAALAKSEAADKHHKLTIAALEKAGKERTAALNAWGHAKDVFAAAEKAVSHAKKVFDAAHVVRTKAQKAYEAAHAAHEAAKKAHAKAVKDEQAATAKEKSAGRARSSAYGKKNAADKAHGKSVSAKSDARKNAIAANHAVKAHSKTMGMFAL